MPKWSIGRRVNMKNGKTGEIKFADYSSRRYVVQGDDGKEYTPTESGITGYEEKPKKRGLFGRNK